MSEEVGWSSGVGVTSSRVWAAKEVGAGFGLGVTGSCVAAFTAAASGVGAGSGLAAIGSGVESTCKRRETRDPLLYIPTWRFINILKDVKFR